MGYVSVALASEDSIEEVLEGYESPQKLFQNENEEVDIKEGSFSESSSTNPRDIPYPILPSWIYSTAIIESSFFDGSFKRGFGTLLKNGFYITSSEVIYNGKITPSKIYVKMQDDLNANIMCVSMLGIKALDLDSGLALLKVANSTDSYCQLRPKSYYQDRIYKRFGIDVFASHESIAPHTKAFYPYLSDMYVFTTQSLELNKVATYYDFERKKEQIYGFEITKDMGQMYDESAYGKAFYDDNGVFLGLLSKAGIGYLPVFVNRQVIQDFLCEIQDKEIINDPLISKACQNLGVSRKRFFTDMKGRANFY